MHKKTSKKALFIPIVLCSCGLFLMLFYGWKYAHETILLGSEKLPVYHPISDTNPQLWPTEPKPGEKIGELDFPALHLDVPVVQGTSPEDLNLGVGHYIESALPGQPGSVFLAGHRDTVFTNLKYLKPGETIIFKTPYGNFTYEMISSQVVPQTDVSVLSNTTNNTMTLMTCFPFIYFGFAPNRYIVHTKLIHAPNLVHSLLTTSPS